MGKKASVGSISASDDIIFDDDIKDLFGKVIGSISKKYYSMVRELSTKNNTYTYELRFDSKAEKVFFNNYRKDSLYSQKTDERIAFTEFIIFLVNNTEFNPVMRYIKSIQPLELDPAFIQEYIDELCQGIIPQQLIDEVEHYYGENEYGKERMESVKAISDAYVCFDMGIVLECKNLLEIFTAKGVACAEFVEGFQKLSRCIDFEESEEFIELNRLCDEYILNPKEHEDAILKCAMNVLTHIDKCYHH